ncbi:MAG: hypothetical protein H7X83_11065 [Verrucomicrobia bacterium]|nr:hypothetical protein [Deltaproteobacteria bacterium]
MKDQAPFLDVRSFVTEEGSWEVLERETSVPATSPFLTFYEAEAGGSPVDPEAEEYVAFLNELYDEELDEGLSTLVDEATAIYETHFTFEQEDPQTSGYQAERLLTQHFAPLVAEAETMFGALARELGQRDLNTLSEDEIGTIVDRYQPSVELQPNFEEFLGKLKKAFKKVANKAVDLAKKGISAAAKLGLGPILEKLKALVKPLLKRVILTAIGKLPAQLQPLARKLAERIPFLKELDESYETAPQAAVAGESSGIQYEFNQQVATLLFAPTEVEQDLEVARVLTEQQVPDIYPLAELDRSRDQFVENLRRLKQGEDPTPHVENFVPAILPALKIGIRLVGRKRVVGFLAGFLGKLIQKFIGPQYAPALSQAIVDAGLRLINLEATTEDESRAAASAVAATVEETVRRVASAPDYVLDNSELLEGFALEAFEQAAAANLPPVLPEETYRKRPDLAEGRKLRGTWIMMPRGRRKRFKKFSRRIPIRIAPHKVASLETFEGIPLEEFLEEQLGLAPGEEVEAFVHLYEAIPGTRLSDIVRQEAPIPKLDNSNGQGQLHPFTREAATLLLGEPELGRDADPRSGSDPHAPAVGQRLYYLEIPGKRPLMIPGSDGRTAARRSTKLRLVLDFPKNEIRVRLFLSEIRAQEIAVKLRQHAHIGTVAARLGRILERGLRRAFIGGFGRLKIVHEAVMPDQWVGALRRLPSLVPQVLMGRLQEWILKGLADHLKQRTEEFIKAAEDTADGVTLVIILGNPPGFPQLRQALKGKVLSPASLRMADGAPAVTITVVPGYSHE